LAWGAALRDPVEPTRLLGLWPWRGPTCHRAHQAGGTGCPAARALGSAPASWAATQPAYRPAW